MKRLTIIGGGITGLAAAWYFQQECAARGLNAECILVEASDRVGGKIQTERTGGFIIESGPDSFITEKPAALELCRELGIESQLLPSNQRQKRVYILCNGRLVPFPEGFRLTIPTRIRPFLATPLLSTRSKIRIFADLFIPARRDTTDESLASFIRRRFGQECLDRIAGPLLGGIFVSDPERLSMQATFPRLLELERRHGSLIRAVRAAAKRAHGHSPKAMFNSLQIGMGELVEALVQRLRIDLRLLTPIKRVVALDGRIWIEPESGASWGSDAVILAVPANRAAPLVRDADPLLAEGLSKIRFVSTAVISLAFRLEDVTRVCPLDGYGVLVPEVEGHRVIAITWSSVKFENRAPQGHVLMRVFLGGYRDECAARESDSALFDLAIRELRSVLGIHARPVLHRIHRWLDANPQYDVGHLDHVARLEALAGKWPGLYLAGSSYRGVGIPDCIESAKRAVQSVITRVF